MDTVRAMADKIDWLGLELLHLAVIPGPSYRELQENRHMVGAQAGGGRRREAVAAIERRFFLC